MIDRPTRGEGFEEGFTILDKRATIFQTSLPVSNEMAFISWPPGTAFNALNSKYNYDDSAGSGQNVYSLDFSANLNSPVSSMR